MNRNNNPFAPASPVSLSPSPNPPFPQHVSPSFNLGGTYDNHATSNLSSLSSSPQPPPQQQQQPQGRQIVVKTKDQNEALAALFADREGGQDTFGNVGQLRCVRACCAWTQSGTHVLFLGTAIQKRAGPCWRSKRRATIRSRSSNSNNSNSRTSGRFSIFRYLLDSGPVHHRFLHPPMSLFASKSRPAF